MLAYDEQDEARADEFHRLSKGWAGTEELDRDVNGADPAFVKYAISSAALLIRRCRKELASPDTSVAGRRQWRRMLVVAVRVLLLARTLRKRESRLTVLSSAGVSTWDRTTNAWWSDPDHDTHVAADVSWTLRTEALAQAVLHALRAVSAIVPASYGVDRHRTHCEVEVSQSIIERRVVASPRAPSFARAA